MSGGLRKLLAIGMAATSALGAGSLESEASPAPLQPFTMSNERPVDHGEFFSRFGSIRWQVNNRPAPEEVSGLRVMPDRWQQSLSEEAMASLPNHDVLVCFHAICPSSLWGLPKK